MSRRFWTRPEIRELRRCYPSRPTTDVATRLARSVSSVNGKAAQLGLRKAPEYLASPAAHRFDGRKGVGTRFAEGHRPWNAGMKGWQAGGRSALTRFKRGERHGTAANHCMPVGHERLIDGYVYVKVADVPNVPYTVNWKPTHVLNWEQAHGRALPDGHVLVFRDGNRRNTVVENLELITRAENMRRNTIHRYPPELRDAMRLAGRVRSKIERLSREEQD